MGKMLSRVIGEDIELVKFLDPELGATKADVGKIEQIIANLALPAPVASSRKTETILLVEDEASVRKTARRILVGQGYIE